MEYTKGEWRPCLADGDGCSCHMIWSVDSDCVVAVAIGAKDENYTGGEGIADEKVIRANAHLIAVAPKQHEALRLVARDWHALGKISQGTMTEVMKALAKVEGKE